MKLFDIRALSTLRGNMGSERFRLSAGTKKPGLSRSEIIANKNREEKAARAKLSLATLKAKLFPPKAFARVAAVKQIGTHNFRVLAGCRIPANAEITRGELESVLRANRFTGYRFAKTGKRVLSLA